MTAMTMTLNMEAELPNPNAIDPSRWAKDHWSVLAYIETRIVDHEGRLDNAHMRCSLARHPQFVSADPMGDVRDGARYPTRLLDGELAEHDDWDCVDDLVSAGLLEWNGTGITPIFALTPRGRLVAHKLREHKAAGGRFSAFRMPEGTP